MNINLPEFFEDRLKTDREMRSYVDMLVVDFDKWLNCSRLPFFPDYTDHGPEHLSCILATVSGLVVDRACRYVTSADVAVLTIATLFHDSAMHLSETGFRTLVNDESKNKSIPGFKDCSWRDAWDEYLFRARRWTLAVKRNVFGNGFASTYEIVKDPFQNFDNLCDVDRKLIGEFIRIHHSRMAHEFSVNGIPGPDGFTPF